MHESPNHGLGCWAISQTSSHYGSSKKGSRAEPPHQQCRRRWRDIGVSAVGHPPRHVLTKGKPMARSALTSCPPRRSPGPGQCGNRAEYILSISPSNLLHWNWWFWFIYFPYIANCSDRIKFLNKISKWTKKWWPIMCVLRSRLHASKASQGFFISKLPRNLWNGQVVTEPLVLNPIGNIWLQVPQ